jgi:hypothetical protein
VAGRGLDGRRCDPFMVTLVSSVGRHKGAGRNSAAGTGYPGGRVEVPFGGYVATAYVGSSRRKNSARKLELRHAGATVGTLLGSRRNYAFGEADDAGPRLGPRRPRLLGTAQRGWHDARRHHGHHGCLAGFPCPARVAEKIPFMFKHSIPRPLGTAERLRALPSGPEYWKAAPAVLR